MTTSGNAAVLDLGRQYPEWQPWLAIVEEVLREATDSKWDAFVTKPLPQTPNVPLLGRANILVDLTAVSRWSERLMQIAFRSGAPKMSTLSHVQYGRLNSADLFKSSIRQDGNWLHTAADGLAVDAEAFQAVALLIAVPFLQACNRHWASWIAECWLEGYCPVRGAGPAFAEVRGVGAT